MLKKIISIQLLIFLITLVVYFIFSNHKPAIYNHHVYIANAFLHGTFEVNNSPSWHNDVAIVDSNKYGIYGPTPAILLLPLVAIFGLDAPEGTLNLILAAIGVVLIYQILTKLKFEEKFKIWLTLFFAFGTLQFFSAAHDQTWWFTYIVFSFLSLLLILEALTRKRFLFLGILAGLAYMTRVEGLFLLIFPLFFLNKSSYKKQLVNLFLGFSGPFIFNSFYNWSRFGNIFENGYAKFVLSEDNFLLSDGVFSLKYIPRNFNNYFLMLPERIESFPYLKPQWMGMSMLLISPVFFYIIKSLKNIFINKLIIASLIVVILVSLPSLIYYEPGWTQFGWKRSVMFTPFLIILTSIGMGGKLNNFKKILILISIMVNLWGVLWWRLNNWFY